jgi:hypothetical protein
VTLYNGINHESGNVISPDAAVSGSEIHINGTKWRAAIMIIHQEQFMHLEIDEQTACITAMGWDTEQTNREKVNFLKEPVSLRLMRQGQAVTPPAQLIKRSDRQASQIQQIAPGAQLCWSTEITAEGMFMQMEATADLTPWIDRLELVFPFDPTVAVASVISSNWLPGGLFRLPAILSLPDLGQMRVSSPDLLSLTGRIEGSRRQRWITVMLDLPLPNPGNPIHLAFTPVVLPLPDGCTRKDPWQAGRRGWFNLIQFSSGASGGSDAVKGVWANNTLSDPVSALVYMLGDATLLVPELAPGVTMPPLLRHAVEYWLDEKTSIEGMVAYTAAGTAGVGDLDEPAGGSPSQNQNVMDANPAVLIGAWCYVKATHDLPWLQSRITGLEKLAAFMLRRDIDGDGLTESRQSGNSGSRPPRNPDCAWDCYCSGHKNAYVNALAYRSWKNLADLERLLDRKQQASLYQQQADRLKTVFLKTFYNPETGWLGFWRSRDGKLHDLAMDTPTSIGIAYGLISPEEGRPMLEKYWQALEQSGFDRFDLGVPLNVRPVPREEMEEYFEFQQFLNGGCGVSNTAWLLDALWQVGMTREANLIFDAMLKRQKNGVFKNGGGFQNGFVDQMGLGAEVFDWQGRPAGYEGHLVYCWSFLHTLLLRDPVIRDRVYTGSICPEDT